VVGAERRGGCLTAGGAVRREVVRHWPQFLGLRWEQLVRERIPRARLLRNDWLPAARWWGNGRDGHPLELDAVAVAADDPQRALVVEAKLMVDPQALDGQLEALRAKAAQCPALSGKRIEAVVWALRRKGGKAPRGLHGPEEVLLV
jgi:hypothetical protein